MGIKRRRYRLLSDFEKVSRYLDEVYDPVTLNGYLLRPFFEYAHTHPYFQHKFTHRFGIWEDDGRIVGFACYEMALGDCLISVREGYNSLIPGILDYAEKELSVKNSDNKSILKVWTVDRETEKCDLLEKRGYEKASAESVTIFPYDKDFPTVSLPKGFSIISLEDENDLMKIDACLWKGFNHGPDPDYDIDGRLLMQSAPNFSKALTTVIKSPDGQYACFAGMWMNEKNKYAYLEPLACVPEHRRKGLATAALVEGMKKTKAMGAEYCFGGVVPFYEAIGFETICHRELWKKEW